MKQTFKQMRISQAKTDEQMKKTSETLERMGIKLGGVTNNQGDVTEEFFSNALRKRPILAGIKYDFIDKNVLKFCGNLKAEYDMILINGKDVAIVETKYKAHMNDAIGLIGKKYENFKILYPEFKDYRHHLALASFHLNDDIKEFAAANGIILLQQNGDIIETILPK